MKKKHTNKQTIHESLNSLLKKSLNLYLRNLSNIDLKNLSVSGHGYATLWPARADGTPQPGRQGPLRQIQHTPVTGGAGRGPRPRAASC